MYLLFKNVFCFLSKDVYDIGVRVSFFKYCDLKLKKLFKIKQPKSNSIIQIWKDVESDDQHDRWQDYLFNITRDGYAVILSSPWYISFISYGYQEWYKWYSIDPMNDFEGF